VELFNNGEFWQAHEAWEEIWQRHDEPWRYFVQGLIQTAAAHHQWQRGIQHGTLKHLHNALSKLETAPADFAGLALQQFREYLHQLLRECEVNGGKEFPFFTPDRVVAIKWLKTSQV